MIKSFLRWLRDPDLVEVQAGLIQRLSAQLSEERQTNKKYAELYNDYRRLFYSMTEVSCMSVTARESTFATEAQAAKGNARNAIFSVKSPEYYRPEKK